MQREEPSPNKLKKLSGKHWRQQTAALGPTLPPIQNSSIIQILQKNKMAQ